MPRVAAYKWIKLFFFLSVFELFEAAKTALFNQSLSFTITGCIALFKQVIILVLVTGHASLPFGRIAQKTFIVYQITNSLCIWTTYIQSCFLIPSVCKKMHLCNKLVICLWLYNIKQNESKQPLEDCVALLALAIPWVFGVSMLLV